jgi:hypothetical protein
MISKVLRVSALRNVISKKKEMRNKDAGDPRNGKEVHVPKNPPGEGSRSKQQPEGTPPKPSEGQKEGKGFGKAN